MLTCTISKEKIQPYEKVVGKDIRPDILKIIQKDYPDFTTDSIISIRELNKYRRRYLTKLVEKEKGSIDSLDKSVLTAIQNNSILSENIEPQIERQLTFGEKVADKIASFGGSWTFIIIFFSFLLGWMAINVWVLTNKPFDPFPFILLNLMLSCLAAIQAPIIMMSQNRQAEKDHIRAEHDYKINLKAELEVRLLNEKVDHLLINQNKNVLKIQEMQIDYLEDLTERMNEIKIKQTNKR